MRNYLSPYRLRRICNRVNDLNNHQRRRGLWVFLFKSVYNYGRCYWCERSLTFKYSTFDHNPPLCFPNSDPDQALSILGIWSSRPNNSWFKSKILLCYQV